MKGDDTLQNKLMLGRCANCFRRIGWRVLGHEMPKWESHLDHYCSGRAQKQAWCQMFMDHLDIIREHQSLPKQLQFEIKNTNISSEIIKIITAHFAHSQNIFRFCIELFSSYLKLKYTDVVNPSKTTILRIAHDYHQFMALLIDMFVLYYGLQDRQIVGEDLFYKSTLPNLAADFIFQNQDASSTILKVAKYSFKTQMEKAQFNIQKNLQLPIDEYGTSQQLRLNDSILKMFKIMQEGESEKPYAGATQIIKQIVRVNNPADKLRLIEGLPKQIESTVRHFYKSHGIKIEGVQINSENLSSILQFIIVQANQPNLLAHLQIVVYFGPKRQVRGGQNCLQHLNNCFQVLELGTIGKVKGRRLSGEEIELHGDVEVKSYFDEVSTFDL